MQSHAHMDAVSGMVFLSPRVCCERICIPLDVSAELMQAAHEELQPYFEHGRRVTGFALLCDGWSDVQGRPLLNFCIATPKGAHFVRAVDTTGYEKDAEFIFEQLEQIMEEIGPEHFVVVIMDGASANVGANTLLEKR